ncbi:MULTISPECIES: Bcr/CflA family efflux MFS transporter [Pseudomonas]|uniref:Bcr/CflA family efflux transporter n=2 Tax=Pseudomonas TaxID=286 RepID=A0A0W0HCI4_PSEFL|nr:MULTISPECIES: Bcr/CflA family efflux MFS transporter [Pseudomonas]KTB58507.1 multidrug transporter CflA [Pseudomonas fluorescens ICMP 11288]RMQ84979.1 hypothetical protein ALP97_00671 [Pseudomonas salomonii]
MPTAAKPVQKPFLVALLMIMTLLGVFPLDVVLPSFPALAEHFQTTTVDIARSVSLFAIGFSCSLLWIGPLSDRIGRKKLLLGSMTVAIGGAVGCIAANDYSQFLLFRVIQAIGCGGFVLSQALVQDLFVGKEQERLRIAIVTAGGIFISISPLVGAWLQLHGGWQTSFYVFTAFALLLMFMTYRLLSDTQPVASATNHNILRGYAKIFSDRHFVSYATISGITFACHFSFIVISPIIFMDQLGLSPYQYSLVLLLYGAAYVFGGLAAGWLNRRMLANTQIAMGLGLIAISGVVMLFLDNGNGTSVWTILIPMLICTAGTTITRPISNSRAMNLFPQSAGAAASATTVVIFIAGGLISALVSTLTHNLSTTLGLCFLLLSTLGLGLNGWAKHRPHVL